MQPRWKIDALIASGLLALGVFAIGSLMTGARYLEVALPGGLPLGNALTALGLCAIAGSGVVIARRGIVRRVALVTLVVAVAWLPVSIAMAGNLALVFSHGRGDTWIAWSAGAAILSLASPVVALAQRLVLDVLPRLARASSKGR